MARKTRMTVFSRLVILMLFIGPLSYLAASYYNGENGVENITNLVQKGKDKVTGASTSTPASTPVPTAPPKVEQKQVETYEMKKLKRQMDELYKENQRLKMKIQNLEAQLQN